MFLSYDKNACDKNPGEDEIRLSGCHMTLYDPFYHLFDIRSLTDICKLSLDMYFMVPYNQRIEHVL